MKKAVYSLKNGKSPGIDEIRAEYLKHLPDIVYERIADLPNHIAETGETPSVLKTGLLVPHQKPGKKRGPASNMRQVIPLSILRQNNGSVRRLNRKNRGEDQPTNTTVPSSLQIRERNVGTGSRHETDDGKSSDYTRI